MKCKRCQCHIEEWYMPLDITRPNAAIAYLGVMRATAEGYCGPCQSWVSTYRRVDWRGSSTAS